MASSQPFSSNVDLANILEKYKEGSRREFDVFVNALKDPDIPDGVLALYLHSLKDNVYSLGRNMEALVGVVFKLDWLNRDAMVIREYQSLVVNLVSAHTYYLKGALKNTVTAFSIDHNFPDEETTVDDSTRMVDEKKFLHLHHMLKTIVAIVPMTPTVLIPLLSEKFPYMTKHHYMQECYVRNLLQITLYLPGHTNRILQVIVDKMVKIDVHAPRDQIEEAEGGGDADDDIIFEMDELDAIDSDINTRTGSPVPLQGLRVGPMSHKEANKLDVLMHLMLTYINNTCYPDGSLNWEATKKLYTNILYAFDRVILPTYACCHIQFLLFYICSFKEQLSEGFVDYLWKKVQQLNTQPVFRQAAVAYLASFLARAKYLSLNVVKTALELMTDWVHTYIKQAAYTSRPDIAHHGPFYSVCQAIFYITIFKHKDILESRKGRKYLETLNLQTLVTSRLNPLKVCLPLVAKTFASVARIHQLAFCDTIMEQNKRTMLPIEGTLDKYTPLTNINPLDSFFPFDPYVLSRSRVFIESLYKEYDGSVVEQNMQSDVEDDEEEFYQNECMSFKENGHSPESWKSDFQDYGTSPGFKNMDAT